MASRARMLKLMQEIRGYAEMANRRPATGPSTALWLGLRPRVLHPVPPKRKNCIPILVPESNLHPNPVRITYVAAGS